MVDINFIVLKYVHTQLGNYCEKEDVEVKYDIFKQLSIKQQGDEKS